MNVAGQMEISEPYFSLIWDGQKKVEGRKMSPTWINLKVGDILNITNPSRLSYQVLITRINLYPPNQGEYDPLTNYLINEGLHSTLPGVSSLSEARAIYLSFWTMEDINRYGVMGIHMLPLKW